MFIIHIKYVLALTSHKKILNAGDTCGYRAIVYVETIKYKR